MRAPLQVSSVRGRVWPAIGMKVTLTEYKVENYHSIRDSGWIKIDDVAVIVGTNESVETSLRLALWKFNSYNELPLSAAG